VSAAEFVFEKTAPANAGAGLRGDAPEYEFSAQLSSQRPTWWRSPSSIRLIAAALEQSPSVTLRELTLGVRRNPLVDPIGIVRRQVMSVESTRIDRPRRIARELRHGQGAGRYWRWRRRDARGNDGLKVVGPIAMPYEKRRGGIITREPLSKFVGQQSF